MKLGINIHDVSWALLKMCSRSEVKGQCHGQTGCYNGGGMDFDDVA